MTRAHAILLLVAGLLAAVIPAQRDAAWPNGWRSSPDGMIGQPMSEPLDSKFRLTKDKASIRVELRLSDATTTAASLMIGNSHIGCATTCCCSATRRAKPAASA